MLHEVASHLHLNVLLSSETVHFLCLGVLIDKVTNLEVLHVLVAEFLCNRIRSFIFHFQRLLDFHFLHHLPTLKLVPDALRRFICVFSQRVRVCLEVPIERQGDFLTARPIHIESVFL